jgi:hypothetical protein
MEPSVAAPRIVRPLTVSDSPRGPEVSRTCVRNAVMWLAARETRSKPAETRSLRDPNPVRRARGELIREESAITLWESGTSEAPGFIGTRGRLHRRDRLFEPAESEAAEERRGHEKSPEPGCAGHSPPRQPEPNHGEAAESHSEEQERVVENGGADELHVNQFGSSLVRESPSTSHDPREGLGSQERALPGASKSGLHLQFAMTPRNSETRELGVRRIRAAMRSERGDGALQG